jgi:hypothetical protein
MEEKGTGVAVLAAPAFGRTWGTPLMYELVACCFFLFATAEAATAVFLTLPGFLGGVMYSTAALMGGAGILILLSKPKDN